MNNTTHILDDVADIICSRPASPVVVEHIGEGSCEFERGTDESKGPEKGQHERGVYELAAEDQL